MLGTLPHDAKTRWEDHVSTLVHAYNCTCSNAMGFSPYFLMYGRDLMLPIDIEFGVWTPNILALPTQSYLQKLQSMGL